jgi:hypothetical protein
VSAKAVKTSTLRLGLPALSVVGMFTLSAISAFSSRQFGVALGRDRLRLEMQHVELLLVVVQRRQPARHIQVCGAEGQLLAHLQRVAQFFVFHVGQVHVFQVDFG